MVDNNYIHDKNMWTADWEAILWRTILLMENSQQAVPVIGSFSSHHVTLLVHFCNLDYDWLAALA